MKRLHDLEAEEVSLVPRGANKKKIIVFKSADGESMELKTKEDVLKAIAKSPECMPKIEKLLKEYKVLKKSEDCDEEDEVAKETNAGVSLDTRAQEALKAIVRIGSPFKEVVPADVFEKVLTEAGLIGPRTEAKGEEMGDKTASARQSPEKIKEEHKIEAMKAATDAFQSHLAKLGYQKYPEEQIAQKDLEGNYGTPGKVVVDPGQEKEQEGTMNDPAEVGKSGVAKGIDLSAFPEKTRPAMEAIFKANQDLIQKNESLQGEVSALKRINRRKEFVAKAANLTHLTGDAEKRIDMLMKLDETDPVQAEEVFKSLELANEQIKKSHLFTEIGSNQGGKAAPTWEAIEAAAGAVVAKSGEKVSKAEAVDSFLRTPDGSRMYSEYIKEHPVNKGRA